MKPRTEEFNAKAARRSPEEFVLGRNLRRRHLSVGQKAAIVLEWSEQIELSADPQKNKGRGRRKGKSRDVAWFDSSVWTIRAVRNWSAAVQSWGKKTRFSIVELHDVSFTGIGCVQRKSGQAGDIGDKAEDVIRGIGRGFSDVAHDVKQAVAGHDVDVSLGETHMEMPTSVDAGAVTFNVTNVGTEERGFKVSGPGLESSFTAPLPPGATEKLTVNLKPGLYQVESPA